MFCTFLGQCQTHSYESTNAPFCKIKIQSTLVLAPTRDQNFWFQISADGHLKKKKRNCFRRNTQNTKPIVSEAQPDLCTIQLSVRYGELSNKMKISFKEKPLCHPALCPQSLSPVKKRIHLQAHITNIVIPHKYSRHNLLYPLHLYNNNIKRKTHRIKTNQNEPTFLQPHHYLMPTLSTQANNTYQ